MENQEPAGGVLQLMEKGGGFLRQPKANFLRRPNDIFVPRNLIERFTLREGVYISGKAVAPQNGRSNKGKSPQLALIEQVNGLSLEDYSRTREFTALVSIDPTERLELSMGNNNLSMRVLDLIAPIGKGQRGLIVAPPKTGKTTLIEQIAEAVADNHEEANLVVLLIDERPEEVTHMKRRVRGEVIASSADQNADFHLQIAQLVHERVKRMVE